MDNPEKLATLGTQDEEKQKHNAICVGHHYTQTSTNNVKTRLEHSYKQLNVKTNRTSVFAENVTDITTRNSKRKDIIGHPHPEKDKQHGMDPTNKPRVGQLYP